VLCCAALASAARGQEPEKPAGPDPVESARSGLRGGDFNWYDRATDDLKRIQVKPPTTPSQSNFNPNAGGVGTAAGIAADGMQIVIWTVIAIILAGLAYMIIQAFLNREAGAEEKGNQQTVEDIDRTEALPIPIERDISDLLAAARKAYERGDYRMAIVYLYSHQLVELDKNQVIHLSKGKTNRQYLREVMRAGRKALGGLLEKTQVLFEEAFFGGRAIGPEQFDPCWNSLGEFDRMVRENTR
jgi:hypothetical protein